MKEIYCWFNNVTCYMLHQKIIFAKYIMFSNMFKSYSLKKCIDKFAKTDDVETREKYKNICKVLERMTVRDDVQVVNERFTQLLHIWFNDNAIMVEICRHLRSKGLCVLHEIIVWKNYENMGETMFLIPHNYGYDDMPNTDKQHFTSWFEPLMYYNTQVNECPNDIMAIPIIVYKHNDEMTHSNMLIVKRQNTGTEKILVEYFEPFGNYLKKNSEFEITQLIHSIFSHDPLVTQPSDIRVLTASGEC